MQRGALSLLAAAASGAPDARLRLFARVFAGAPFEESVRALRGVRCALGQASETLSPQVMCTVDFIEHEGLEVVAEMLLGEGEGSEGDGEGETEEGDQGTRRGTELAQKTECEAGRSREGLAAEQSSTDVSARRISDAVERRDESTESGAEPGCSLTIGPDARRAAGRAQRVPRAAAGEEGSAGFWGFSNSDVVQLRLLTEVSNFEPAGEAEEEVWEKLKRAASDWTEKEMEGIVHFCVRLGLDNTVSCLDGPLDLFGMS